MIYRTGLAAFVCQMFYCYRIFVMSKRKNIWLPCVIAALSLASFGKARWDLRPFAARSLLRMLSTPSPLLLQASPLAPPSRSSSSSSTRRSKASHGASSRGLFALLLPTSSSPSLSSIICLRASRAWRPGPPMGEWPRPIFLRRAPAHRDSSRRSVLNKIIQLTIETNGVTAVVAVIDAFLFGLSSSSLHVIPNLALVKLYFNALLVSRESFRLRVVWHSCTAMLTSRPPCPVNARVELEKQIMGSRNGLSHQQQQSHNGGQSVTTALGFGRQDVDPNYVKARGPLDVHIQTT